MKKNLLGIMGFGGVIAVRPIEKRMGIQIICRSFFARTSTTKGKAILKRSIDEFRRLPVPSRMAKAIAVVAYAPSICTR